MSGCIGNKPALSEEEEAEICAAIKAIEEEDAMTADASRRSPFSGCTPSPKRVKHMPTLVTGGALGADSVWAAEGRTAGLKVEIMSFEGHKMKIPSGASVQLLTANDIRAADAALATAASRLRRPMASGRNLYVRNLLRRNHTIVARADALFAVGSLEEKRPAALSSVQVAGGTGWSCQLFADVQPSALAALDLFLFDQRCQSWFQCRMTAAAGRPLCWAAISLAEIVSRRSRWRRIAAVGTRKLSQNGRTAIKAVLESWK